MFRINSETENEKDAFRINSHRIESSETFRQVMKLTSSFTRDEFEQSSAQAT